MQVFVLNISFHLHCRQDELPQQKFDTKLKLVGKGQIFTIKRLPSCHFMHYSIAFHFWLCDVCVGQRKAMSLLEIRKCENMNKLFIYSIRIQGAG